MKETGSRAHGDSFEVSADGLRIALAHDCHLGTNRALRFEPALPMKPYLALRAGEDEHCAFKVASCAAAYFEVAIGQPDPSRGFGVRDCIAKSCQFSAAFIRELEGDVSTVTRSVFFEARC